MFDFETDISDMVSVVGVYENKVIFGLKNNYARYMSSVLIDEVKDNFQGALRYTYANESIVAEIQIIDDITEPEIDDAPPVEDELDFEEMARYSENRKGEPEVIEDEPVVKESLTTAVSVFNFENHNVRTAVDDKGAIWFVAKDVAEALSYSETSAMTRKLDDDEVMSAKLAGMNMNSVFINESGLFSSILGSAKPEAKRFKKWVTSEVLPSIRKTGKYEAPKGKKIDLLSPEFIAAMRKVRTVQLATGMTKVQSSKFAREVIKREFGADMVHEVIGDYIQQLDLV
jgi:prophage antirepressor-like protein